VLRTGLAHLPAARCGALPSGDRPSAQEEAHVAARRPRRGPGPGRVPDCAHLADVGDPSDHVFIAPNGGPLRVTAFRARAWRPATKAAALDGLRIHDLRHTAVALWIAAGASPKEVAALAGHTSVSFTLDRYGHLYPDSYATLRDRLDALHSSAQACYAEVIDLPSTARRQQ
jgi:integrase